MKVLILLQWLHNRREPSVSGVNRIGPAHLEVAISMTILASIQLTSIAVKYFAVGSAWYVVV